MTRQMFSYDCDEVRKLTYDNRKNALNQEDANRFQLHLEGCQTCSDYVARTEGMLDAASQIEYGKNIDPNDLFAAIMSDVQNDTVEEIFTPVVVIQETEEEPTKTFSKPLRYGLLAVAAAMLLGFSYQFLPDLSPETTSIISSPSESAKEKNEIKANEIKPQPSQLADLVLQPSPMHAKNLNIFGDSLAEWKVTGNRLQNFELTEGTVLIEYVPSDRSASLKLRTTEFTIQVLGTIFYASKASQVVGVIAGKIRLQTEDGEEIVLERGQEYIPGIGLRNTNPKLLLESEKFVDVQRHNQLLSVVPKAKKDQKQKKTQVAALKKRDLRKEADLAISKGDYKIAAKIMERMVNELPASAPENATLQLDLARIYIKQLKQPRRAFGHLERFTKQRPLDAATPSAKKEMCRISKRFNLRDREACQE